LIKYNKIKYNLFLIMSTSAENPAYAVDLAIDRASSSVHDRQFNTSTVGGNAHSGYLTEIDIAKIVA
jgi:flavin-binding protein dodecin